MRDARKDEASEAGHDGVRLNQIAGRVNLGVYARVTVIPVTVIAGPVPGRVAYPSSTVEDARPSPVHRRLLLISEAGRVWTDRAGKAGYLWPTPTQAAMSKNHHQAQRQADHPGSVPQ